MASLEHSLSTYFQRHELLQLQM